MGSGGVLAPEGRQFVVAAVRSTPRSGGPFDAAADPPRDAFSLVVGDESYPAVDIEDRTTGARTASLAGRSEATYDTPWGDSPSVGWVAFEPPSPLDVGETNGSAEIRCGYGGETAAWPLPDGAAATLVRPAPTFELRSLGAEWAADETAIDLSLAAENTSDTDGEFLAAVYLPTHAVADDESHLVRRQVAAGDSVEWSERFDSEYVIYERRTVEVRVDGVVSGPTECRGRRRNGDGDVRIVPGATRSENPPWNPSSRRAER
jgi:hypothetical protein